MNSNTVEGLRTEDEKRTQKHRGIIFLKNQSSYKVKLTFFSWYNYRTNLKLYCSINIFKNVQFFLILNMKEKRHVNIDEFNY